MNIIYTGPEGQANHEVGVLTGKGDMLEPGSVYDLPRELANRLVNGDARWERVTDYDELNDKQLKEIAAEEEIEGRSKMKRAELIAALRGEEYVEPAGDGDGSEPETQEVDQ